MAKKPEKDIEKLKAAGKMDQFNEIVGELGQTPNAGASIKGGDRVPAETFEGKTAPIATVIPWVAENLGISDVAATDAPCASAWALLKWAQRGEANEAEFWRNIYAKLLPSRAQLEAQEHFKDDGRELTGLEDELLRMAAEAKRRAEEPPEAATGTQG